jgi:pimeloyl-ACP methyl ester carboxylesterase
MHGDLETPPVVVQWDGREGTSGALRMSGTTDARSSLVVNGVKIETIERGKGRPILFLHPNIGIEANAPVLDALAKGGRVIAPTHPGFGASDLPKGMTSIDDLSYFYLDLMQQLDLRDVLMVGVGIGGWLACEIAVKTTERIDRLVLGNPLGIKVGDRETRDIFDIWSVTQPEVDALAYFDPAIAKRDYKAMPEADVLAAARNREAVARVAWSPYMHNPKLRGRLRRIDVPVLILWGATDRIVLNPQYGKSFAAAIPGARLETIERAGHYPHIEQPDEFARRALAFAEQKQPAKVRA